MEIMNGTIILRDFAVGHLPGRIRFETTDTEWKLWDGPWEHEGLNEEQELAELAGLTTLLHARARRNMSLPDSETRQGFEIFTRDTGEHIGWVNSYSLTPQLVYSETRTELTALGIVIAPPGQRQGGRGKAALGLFVRYLLERGVTELYTQTWSGNTAMIALARGLGFQECARLPGARTVRGESYDALTFKLDVAGFQAICHN